MKPFMLTLLLLAGTGVATAADTIALSETQLRQLGIRTQEAQPASTLPVALAPARVTVPPEQEYIVSTPQGGLVTKLHAALGQPVQAGQVLAEVASPGLVSLQQQLLTAATQRDLAKSRFQRADMLHREGIIAKREWQEAKANLDAQNILVAEHRELLRMAGLGSAEIDGMLESRRFSSHLRLTAPASGVITEQLAVSGQRVDSQAPLYRLARLDKLWLEIDLPQEHVGSIVPGDTVRAPGVDARIILIGQSVDPMAQTVLVRAEVLGQPRLLPNQKFKVEVLHAEGDGLLQVPSAAVFRQGGQDYVFVRSAEGFVVQPVERVSSAGSQSLLRGQLPGTAVAVQGVSTLKAKWIGVGGNE